MKYRNAAVGALLSVSVLSGCAVLPDIVATQPAEPMRTPTPSLHPEDLDGDGQVTEYERGIYAKRQPREYRLPNGSSIEYRPTDEELPAEIASDLIRRLEPDWNAYTAPTCGTRHADTVHEQLRSMSDELGRELVLVFFSPSWWIDCGNGSSTGVQGGWGAFSTSSKFGLFAVVDSRDSAIAQARAWIGSRQYWLIAQG